MRTRATSTGPVQHTPFPRQQSRIPPVWMYRCGIATSSHACWTAVIALNSYAVVAMQCHQKSTLGHVTSSYPNTNQPDGSKSAGLGRLQNWAGLAELIGPRLLQCLSGSRRGGGQREPESSKPGFGGQWETEKPSTVSPKVATAIRAKFPELPMIVRAKVGQTHRPKAPIIRL